MRPKPKRCTARGNLVRDTGTGAPTEKKLSDGQLADHYVLCAEDRAKGYVEPCRESYIHIGPPGPEFELDDLTDEQRKRYADFGYVKYEPYPQERGPAVGKYWTAEALAKVGKGCGVKTSMSLSIAQTYAAQPEYYGSTFCAGCGGYFRVGRDGEFVWDRESMQRVGTRRAAS